MFLVVFVVLAVLQTMFANIGKSASEYEQKCLCCADLDLSHTLHICLDGLALFLKIPSQTKDTILNEYSN